MGKFVTKNRSFGNNTIFLQQFFSVSGGGGISPLPPWLRSWKKMLSIHCTFKLNLAKVVYDWLGLQLRVECNSYQLTFISLSFPWWLFFFVEFSLSSFFIFEINISFCDFRHPPQLLYHGVPLGYNAFLKNFTFLIISALACTLCKCGRY